MSYESCLIHEGEEATNGCKKCVAEEREYRLICLDNFLARWFGGTGEREATFRFLKKFREEGFVVHDDESGVTLSPDAGWKED